MQLINSYIFLQKEKETEMKKDSKGDYVLELKSTIPTLFQKLFSVEDNELKPKELEFGKDEKIKDLFNNSYKGKCKVSLNDGSTHEVKYKFTNVNSSYYLDIFLERQDEEIGIEILEKINDIMIVNKNAINTDYVIIRSYDSISEFYCNKIYPKLNKFERKLRKLLYLIYTGQFEKEYFKKTTSEKLQSSIKEKIRSKENNQKKKEWDYAQRFFESFDFGELRSLLFETRWTEVEKIEIENFLNDNKDLTMLSDKELREFIQTIKPKSDWERFFKNKGITEAIEDNIKNIGNLRNCVAHNKSFNKEQYLKLLELLEKNEKEIDKAIVITEDEDFIRINEERIQRTLRSFSNSMMELQSTITKVLMPIYEKEHTEIFTEIGDMLKEIPQSFLDSRK